MIYGQEVFQNLLAGRNVRWWCDNAGGAASVIRGGAKCSDHNQLIHRFWSRSFRIRMNCWMETVPSDDTISDGATREDFRVLSALGAVLIDSIEPKVYW